MASPASWKRAYAKAHNIRIARIFREEGVSGTKDLANRPAFVEMMTAPHSNGVHLVLVEKLDGLARDLMVQETIIGDLRKHGFDLISVAEPEPSHRVHDLALQLPSRIILGNHPPGVFPASRGPCDHSPSRFVQR